MSINATPISHKQAKAVMRRLVVARRKSEIEAEFKIVGTRDMHYVQELRVRMNPRTGKRAHEVIMHGKELSRHVRAS